MPAGGPRSSRTCPSPSCAGCGPSSRGWLRPTSKISPSPLRLISKFNNLLFYYHYHIIFPLQKWLILTPNKPNNHYAQSLPCSKSKSPSYSYIYLSIFLMLLVNPNLSPSLNFNTFILTLTPIQITSLLPIATSNIRSSYTLWLNLTLILVLLVLIFKSRRTPYPFLPHMVLDLLTLTLMFDISLLISTTSLTSIS